MKANGHVFKYGDNVDTDVIIPARYLNSSDPAELAQHCMEDIDREFVQKVQKGDIIVIEPNEASDFEALEDTISVVVKMPCVLDDKYLGEAK